MVFVWSVGLALLWGCGESLPLKSVSGTVSYQGSALDHGSLRFFGENGRPIGSVIQQDGSYQVDLLPGEYRVSVSFPPKLPPGYKEGDRLPPDPSAVPAKYTQPNSSGLSTTVGKESLAQTYDIALE